jgi:hypothetical protein
MRNRSIRRIVVCFLSLCPVLLSLPPHAAAAAEGDKMSITRTYDVLEVDIGSLTGVLDGTRAADLRVVRFRDGTLEPVPFDLMEKDENGNYILDAMNKNVDWKNGTYELREDAVKAAGGMKKVRIDLVDNTCNQPGLLDGRDQIAFLARDAGDRHSGEIPGAARGIELRIQDPVDQGTGWVYLVEAPGIPRSTEQYVSYTFDKDRQIERVKSEGGAEVMFDLNKSAAYRDFILPANGGIDIAHTFPAEASFKLKPAWLSWLPRFSINPENSSIPILVGDKDGVFVLRVVKNKIDNFLLEKYLGDEIKRSELVTVSHYYPNYQYFEGVFPLSQKLKRWMKDLDVVMTTDFNENAKGMVFLNANNLEAPCNVDGKMDEREKGLNQDPYQWSLLTGSAGGWANILDMKNNKDLMRLFYDDDAKQDIYGSIGYRMTQIDEKDTLRFKTYIFLTPPNAGPEQMKPLVDLVYRPLEVTPGRSFGPTAPPPG